MKENNSLAELEQRGWVFVRNVPLIYDRLSDEQFIVKLIHELESRGRYSTESIGDIMEKVSSSVDKMKNTPLTQIDEIIKNDYEKKSGGEFLVTDAYDSKGKIIVNARAVYRK